MRGTINLEPKDLEYTLSTIYGKKMAKILVKQGHTLHLKEKEDR